MQTGSRLVSFWVKRNFMLWRSGGAVWLLAAATVALSQPDSHGGGPGNSSRPGQRGCGRARSLMLRCTGRSAEDAR